MRIRSMIETDIAACASLMAKTPLWQHYGVTEDSATERFTAALRDGAEILVADGQDAGIVGFVWFVLRGAFNRSGYIPLIGVDESARGGGIGAQLLTAAEEKVGQTSRDIFLLCSHFNIDAQRFYERHGYERVGAIPDYVVPGVNEIIYRKRLPKR